MLYKKIEIIVDGYEETADLYTYILDNSIEMNPERKRPVIVICPGGGYTKTSDREAEPVAMQYLAKGYHAVILRYSVAPARYPAALLQLAETVAYLRKNAEEFHIDTEKIILLGFSAGAHLAASLGVFWKKDFIAEKHSSERRKQRTRTRYSARMGRESGQIRREDNLRKKRLYRAVISALRRGVFGYCRRSGKYKNRG